MGVIKPVNNHGSVNVYLWSSKDEAKEVLNLIKSQKSNTFLLEEKIVGPEFSVESWVEDGKIIYSSITKKTTFKSDGMEFPVEIGHEVHFEEFSEDVYDQIINMNKFVIEKSEVENAIVHLEFKLDSNNLPKIME